MKMKMKFGYSIFERERERAYSFMVINTLATNHSVLPTRISTCRYLYPTHVQGSMFLTCPQFFVRCAYYQEIPTVFFFSRNLDPFELEILVLY